MELRNEFLFEQNVLEMFHNYCRDKERIVIEPADLNIELKDIIFRPDIYLPNGCKALNLKPKTIVELRLSLNFTTIHYLRVIKNYYDCIMHRKGYHFLVVLMEKDESLNLLPEMTTNDFQIITYDKLKECLHNTSINESDERDETNKEELILKKAKSVIATQPCSFILGAGVSIDAGLPAWDGLLKKLIGIANKNSSFTLEEKDYQHIFKDCGSSSIILGRFVYTLFNDDKDKIKKAIQEALYQGMTWKPGDLTNAVCKLIKTVHDRHNLTSIITYNYDDLIEQGLQELEVFNLPLLGKQKQNQFVPIYHVHGFLSQENDIYSKIVLSEKDYHDIYKTSYHWSNVEQLHAMQRSTCFFIGLSMTDPNLRRLLDMSKSESSESQEITHFVFLRREDVSGDLAGSKADEFRKKMESMLEGLGVATIWYNMHSELPGILNDLI